MRLLSQRETVFAIIDALVAGVKKILPQPMKKRFYES